MNIRFKKIVSIIILIAFVVVNAGPSCAQTAVLLPEPGTRMALSQPVDPFLLKGIRVYRSDPFRFDFILDKGYARPNVREGGETPPLREEIDRLIKYFLASLTIPEKDLWVNLSPYEKDRIVPEAFGRTEMGRDLLAQDYLLKQITASVLYPEGETGNEFWNKVYAEAQKRYGTTDIPVDTFNKVWIVPEKATVYENKDAAFVVESKLKVMLDSDYVATTKSVKVSEYQSVREEGLESGLLGHKYNSHDATGHQLQATSSNNADIAKKVLKDVILPVLEKEVNEGRNFASLRQVYHSLILATWYKRKVKESLIGQAYVDHQKTAGIDITDKAEAEKIWQRYVEAFRKGAYNLVREEVDPVTKETIPRKYVSGGANFAMEAQFQITADSAMLPQTGLERGMVVQMRADMAKTSVQYPAADNSQAADFVSVVKRSAVHYQQGSDTLWEALAKQQGWNYELCLGDLVAINDQGVLLMGTSGVGKSRLAYRIYKKKHEFLGSDLLQLIEYNGIVMGGPSTISRFNKMQLSYRNAPIVFEEGTIYPVNKFVPIKTVVYMTYDGTLTTQGRVDSYDSMQDLLAALTPEDRETVINKIKDMTSGKFIKLSLPEEKVSDEELDRLADIIIAKTADQAMSSPEVAQSFDVETFTDELANNLRQMNGRTFMLDDLVDPERMGFPALERFPKGPDGKPRAFTFQEVRSIVKKVEGQLSVFDDSSLHGNDWFSLPVITRLIRQKFPDSRVITVARDALAMNVYDHWQAVLETGTERLQRVDPVYLGYLHNDKKRLENSPWGESALGVYKIQEQAQDVLRTMLERFPERLVIDTDLRRQRLTEEFVKEFNARTSGDTFLEATLDDMLKAQILALNIVSSERVVVFDSAGRGVTPLILAARIKKYVPGVRVDIALGNSLGMEGTREYFPSLDSKDIHIPENEWPYYFSGLTSDTRHPFFRFNLQADGFGFWLRMILRIYNRARIGRDDEILEAFESRKLGSLAMDKSVMYAPDPKVKAASGRDQAMSQGPSVERRHLISLIRSRFAGKILRGEPLNILDVGTGKKAEFSFKIQQLLNAEGIANRVFGIQPQGVSQYELIPETIQDAEQQGITLEKIGLEDFNAAGSEIFRNNKIDIFFMNGPDFVFTMLMAKNIRAALDKDGLFVMTRLQEDQGPGLLYENTIANDLEREFPVESEFVLFEGLPATSDFSDLGVSLVVSFPAGITPDRAQIDNSQERIVFPVIGELGVDLDVLANTPGETVLSLMEQEKARDFRLWSVLQDIAKRTAVSAILYRAMYEFVWNATTRSSDVTIAIDRYSVSGSEIYYRLKIDQKIIDSTNWDRLMVNSRLTWQELQDRKRRGASSLSRSGGGNGLSNYAQLADGDISARLEYEKDGRGGMTTTFWFKPNKVVQNTEDVRHLFDAAQNGQPAAPSDRAMKTLPPAQWYPAWRQHNRRRVAQQEALRRPQKAILFPQNQIRVRLVSRELPIALRTGAREAYEDYLGMQAMGNEVVKKRAALQQAGILGNEVPMQILDLGSGQGLGLFSLAVLILQEERPDLLAAFNKAGDQNIDKAIFDIVTYLKTRYHFTGVDLLGKQDILPALTAQDNRVYAAKSVKALELALENDGVIESRKGSIEDLPVDWSGRFHFVVSVQTLRYSVDELRAWEELSRILSVQADAYVHRIGGYDPGTTEGEQLDFNNIIIPLMRQKGIDITATALDLPVDELSRSKHSVIHFKKTAPHEQVIFGLTINDLGEYEPFEPDDKPFWWDSVAVTASDLVAAGKAGTDSAQADPIVAGPDDRDSVGWFLKPEIRIFNNNRGILARAVERIVRSVHDTDTKAVIMSGKGADIFTKPVFLGVWKKLYDSSPPEVYVLGDEANRKLYKDYALGETSPYSAQEKIGIVKSALGLDSSGFESLRRSRVVFLDDSIETGIKVNDLGYFFNVEAGFLDLKMKVFLASPVSEAWRTEHQLEAGAVDGDARNAMTRLSSFASALAEGIGVPNELQAWRSLIDEAIRFIVEKAGEGSVADDAMAKDSPRPDRAMSSHPRFRFLKGDQVRAGFQKIMAAELLTEKALTGTRGIPAGTVIKRYAGDHAQLSRRDFLIGAGAASAIGLNARAEDYHVGLDGVRIIENFESFIRGKPRLPRGMYQVGEFHPQRPTVVIVHGAAESLVYPQEYIKSFQKAGINVLAYQYNYADPLEVNAKRFREDLWLALQKRSTPRLSILAFSFGGNIAVWSVFQALKDSHYRLDGIRIDSPRPSEFAKQDVAIFRNAHFILVSSPLNGSIQTEGVFRPFVSAVWPVAQAVDQTGRVQFIDNVTPGNEKSSLIQRNFETFRASVGSFHFLLGDQDEHFPLTNPRGQGHIPDDQMEALRRANATNIYPYARVYPGLNHQGMLEAPTWPLLQDLSELLLREDISQPGQGRRSPYDPAMSDKDDGSFLQEVQRAADDYKAGDNWWDLAQQKGWTYALAYGDMVSYQNNGILLMADSGVGKTRLAYSLYKKGSAYLGSDLIQVIGQNGVYVAGLSRDLVNKEDQLKYRKYSGGEKEPPPGRAVFPTGRFAEIRGAVALVYSERAADSLQVDYFDSLSELSDALNDHDRWGMPVDKIKGLRSGVFVKVSLPFKHVSDGEFDSLADSIIEKVRRMDARTTAVTGRDMAMASGQGSYWLHGKTLYRRGEILEEVFGTGIQDWLSRMDDMVRGSDDLARQEAAWLAGDSEVLGVIDDPTKDFWIEAIRIMVRTGHFPHTKSLQRFSQMVREHLDGKKRKRVPQVILPLTSYVNTIASLGHRDVQEYIWGELPQEEDRGIRLVDLMRRIQALGLDPGTTNLMHFYSALPSEVRGLVAQVKLPLRAFEQLEAALLSSPVREYIRGEMLAEPDLKVRLVMLWRKLRELGYKLDISHFSQFYSALPAEVRNLVERIDLSETMFEEVELAVDTVRTDAVSAELFTARGLDGQRILDALIKHSLADRQGKVIGEVRRLTEDIMKDLDGYDEEEFKIILTVLAQVQIYSFITGDMMREPDPKLRLVDLMRKARRLGLMHEVESFRGFYTALPMWVRRHVETPDVPYRLFEQVEQAVGTAEDEIVTTSKFLATGLDGERIMTVLMTFGLVDAHGRVQGQVTSLGEGIEKELADLSEAWPAVLTVLRQAQVRAFIAGEMMQEPDLRRRSVLLLQKIRDLGFVIETEHLGQFYEALPKNIRGLLEKVNVSERVFGQIEFVMSQAQVRDFVAHDLGTVTDLKYRLVLLRRKIRELGLKLDIDHLGSFYALLPRTVRDLVEVIDAPEHVYDQVEQALTHSEVMRSWDTDIMNEEDLKVRLAMLMRRIKQAGLPLETENLGQFYSVLPLSFRQQVQKVDLLLTVFEKFREGIGRSSVQTLLEGPAFRSVAPYGRIDVLVDAVRKETDMGAGHREAFYKALPEQVSPSWRKRDFVPAIAGANAGADASQARFDQAQGQARYPGRQEQDHVVFPGNVDISVMRKQGVTAQKFLQRHYGVMEGMEFSIFKKLIAQLIGQLSGPKGKALASQFIVELMHNRFKDDRNIRDRSKTTIDVTVFIGMKEKPILKLELFQPHITEPRWQIIAGNSMLNLFQLGNGQYRESLKLKEGGASGYINYSEMLQSGAYLGLEYTRYHEGGMTTTLWAELDNVPDDLEELLPPSDAAQNGQPARSLFETIQGYAGQRSWERFTLNDVLSEDEQYRSERSEEMGKILLQGDLRGAFFVFEELRKNARAADPQGRYHYEFQDEGSAIAVRIKNEEGHIDFSAIREAALQKARQGVLTIKKTRRSGLMYLETALPQFVAQFYYSLSTIEDERIFDAIKADLEDAQDMSVGDLEALQDEDWLKIMGLGKILKATKKDSLGIGLPAAFAVSGMDVGGYELRLASRDPVTFEVRIRKADRTQVDNAQDRILFPSTGELGVDVDVLGKAVGETVLAETLYDWKARKDLVPPLLQEVERGAFSRDTDDVIFWLVTELLGNAYKRGGRTTFAVSRFPLAGRETLYRFLVHQEQITDPEWKILQGNAGLSLAQLKSRQARLDSGLAEKGARALAHFGALEDFGIPARLEYEKDGRGGMTTTLWVRADRAQTDDTQDADALFLGNAVSERLGFQPLKENHFSNYPLEVKGRTLSFYSESKHMVSVIGGKVFIGLGDPDRKTSLAARNVPLLLRQAKEALGELYESNQNRIFFLPNSSAVTSYSFNHYTASVSALMEEHAGDIKDAVVVDIGAAEGVLSQVALALGAKKVILIERGDESCRIARILLEDKGYVEGRDFEILKKNLEDADLLGLLQDKTSGETKIVTISNIGPWEESYGRAHDYALSLMLQLRSQTAFVGGFDLNAEHVDVLANNVISFSLAGYFSEFYSLNRVAVAFVAQGRAGSRDFTDSAVDRLIARLTAWSSVPDQAMDSRVGSVVPSGGSFETWTLPGKEQGLGPTALIRGIRHPLSAARNRLGQAVTVSADQREDGLARLLRTEEYSGPLEHYKATLHDLRTLIKAGELEAVAEESYSSAYAKEQLEKTRREYEERIAGYLATVKDSAIADDVILYLFGPTAFLYIKGELPEDVRLVNADNKYASMKWGAEYNAFSSLLNEIKGKTDLSPRSVTEFISLASGLGTVEGSVRDNERLAALAVSLPAEIRLSAVKAVFLHREMTADQEFRNAWMAGSLRNALKAASVGKKVYAIVGVTHAEGMKSYWADPLSDPRRGKIPGEEIMFTTQRVLLNSIMSLVSGLYRLPWQMTQSPGATRIFAGPLELIFTLSLSEAALVVDIRGDAVFQDILRAGESRWRGTMFFEAPAPAGYRRLVVTIAPSHFARQFDEMIRRQLESIQPDRAMSGDKGGIDLNAVEKTVSVGGEGEAVKFDIDPVMLAQLLNASGLTPVVINILPLSDLGQFLGITK
jgi:hypothetical protein